MKSLLPFIVILFPGVMLVCNKAKIKEKQTEITTESRSKPLNQKGTTMPEKIIKSDEEWKRILTPEQYKGTLGSDLEYRIQNLIFLFFKSSLCFRLLVYPLSSFFCRTQTYTQYFPNPLVI